MSKSLSWQVEILVGEEMNTEITWQRLDLTCCECLQCRYGPLWKHA